MRSRLVRGVLAATVVIGFVGVAVLSPAVGSNPASAEVVPLAIGEKMNQQLMLEATESIDIHLAAPGAEKLPEPEPEPATQSGGFAPPAGVPDPGTAQAIALGYVGAGAEFDCLVALWNKESHWNAYAMNRSSGAYGIPQALPGSKMASAGDDWETNPETQIRWGLGYIQGRYGSPCGAWAHSQDRGWY